MDNVQDGTARFADVDHGLYESVFMCIFYPLPFRLVQTARRVNLRLRLYSVLRGAHTTAYSANVCRRMRYFVHTLVYVAYVRISFA